MTEERSAVLNKLTRLQHLGLHGDKASVDPAQVQAIFNLNMSMLERLELSCFGLSSLRLKCPNLGELLLDCIALQSFSGMPSTIQKVRLNLFKESLPLEDVLPGHSCKLLEELVICQDSMVAGLGPIQDLCLSGKLRCLKIHSIHGSVDAFSKHAVWEAIPQTLQHLTLPLHLDKGIPMILEQLHSLVTLSLRHTCIESTYMHLDRPLDPFLDMPRLEVLSLQSDWNIYEVEDTVAWTAAGLRFLGMAAKRIMQMRLTSPGRSFTLTY